MDLYLSIDAGDCLFQPLEDVIRAEFIPTLLKRDINDLERELLSLPVRMGGMGISKPTEQCQVAHFNSMYVSTPLVKLITRQIAEFDPRELSEEMKTLRADIDTQAEKRHTDKRDTLLGHIGETMKIALKAAGEKGASSWMTAVPSYDHGTILHKREFVDACYMRYGWDLLDLPVSCDTCGGAFSLQHSLDCQHGGLRQMR